MVFRRFSLLRYGRALRAMALVVCLAAAPAAAQNNSAFQSCFAARCTQAAMMACQSQSFSAIQSCVNAKVASCRAACAHLLPNAGTPDQGTPDPGQRAKNAFERMKDKYNRMMESEVAAGDTRMNAGELARTAGEVVKEWFTEMKAGPGLRAFLRGQGRVTGNPVMQIADPLLDVENARNIDQSVQAMRRQNETGTINRSQANELNDIMAELDRQGRGE